MLAFSMAEVEEAQALHEGRGHMLATAEGNPATAGALASGLLAGCTGTLLPSWAVACLNVFDPRVAAVLAPHAARLLRALEKLCATLPETVASSARFDEAEGLSQSERVRAHHMECCVTCIVCPAVVPGEHWSLWRWW